MHSRLARAPPSGNGIRRRPKGGREAQVGDYARMEFQDVVRKRRMHRKFTDEPVPAEAVERITRNAVRAPSAGFSQGWAFVVLE
ncbi:nitroreductase family protein, partial [Streptomyces griseoincarnatus]